MNSFNTVYTGTDSEIIFYIYKQYIVFWSRSECEWRIIPKLQHAHSSVLLLNILEDAEFFEDANYEISQLFYKSDLLMDYTKHEITDVLMKKIEDYIQDNPIDVQSVAPKMRQL